MLHIIPFETQALSGPLSYASLKRISADAVGPGQKLAPQTYQDIEVFSYVLDGTLEHKDGLGNNACVSAGGVQFISAGSGLDYQDVNPSPTDDTQALKIWMIPNKSGVPPRHRTLDIAPADKRGRLCLMLSGDGRDGSLRIQQDANIYAALITDNECVIYTLPTGRKGYVHIARGCVAVNGKVLRGGDAVMFDGTVQLNYGQDADILIFDLAPL